MKKLLICICCLTLFGCASYFENRIDKDFVGTGGLFEVGGQVAGQGLIVRFATGTFAIRPVGSGDKTSFDVKEGVRTESGNAIVDKAVTITQENADPCLPDCVEAEDSD